MTINQLMRMHVIGAEHNIFWRLFNERDKSVEVFSSAAFANLYRHSERYFLTRLMETRTLVICGNS